MYNLPVPVWLYLYGAAAALVLSFVVIGIFVAATPERSEPRSKPLSWLNHPSFRSWAQSVLRVIAALTLVLCIVSGYIGTQNAYYNINMTLFWVLFVLGLTYLVAVSGNLYAAVNPWEFLAEQIGRIWKSYEAGIVRIPEKTGYWPALGLYMAFIWLELFGNSNPAELSNMLLAYSVLNLVGVYVVGRKVWFQRFEFFSVFFRLVSKMAPLQFVDEAGQGSRFRLYAPFMGLLRGRATSVSLLVFILFMLSSTAFDGLRETVTWRKLFWVELYHLGLKDLTSANPLAAFPVMNRWYGWWQSFWLLASPFVYLAVYWLFIWFTKLFARSDLTVRDLALRFGYSLLPIALVYHVTHYYTLIQIQGVKILPLVSDPLGRQWDLFGTADMLRLTIIPNAERVWHVQVGLIVFGHIVSVYIAHMEALRTFPTHRQALMSQIPMLILMVILTTVGLWILSEPIQPGA